MCSDDGFSCMAVWIWAAYFVMLIMVFEHGFKLQVSSFDRLRLHVTAVAEALERSQNGMLVLQSVKLSLCHFSFSLLSCVRPSWG